MVGTSDPAPGSSPAEFPREGRLLGVDYGTRRLGFAVSTPDQTIASPLANYERRDERLDASRLAEIVEEYRVVGLVIGLPVHMSGDEGGKAHEARTFGTWAAGVTGLPVRYWDERHTSLIAESYLMGADMSRKKRKARLDMLAAQVLLQRFLDASDRDQTPGAM